MRVVSWLSCRSSWPISDKVGCSSPHGVAVFNDTHYFLHKTGVYAFDGAQVVPIGNAVQKEALRRIGDVANLSGAQSAVDEQEGVIYFGFPAKCVFNCSNKIQ